MQHRHIQANVKHGKKTLIQILAILLVEGGSETSVAPVAPVTTVTPNE